MDQILSTFISWQLILFCLGIYALTFIFRKAVEYFVLDNPKLPGNRTSQFWRDFILPVFPMVCGALIGLIAPKFPFPEQLHVLSGRVIFGFVCGMFSSLVYRIVNSFVANKFGIKLDNEDKK